jgi:hypothetical protein
MFGCHPGNRCCVDVALLNRGGIASSSATSRKLGIQIKGDITVHITFPMSLAAGLMALSATTLNAAAQHAGDSKVFEFPMVVSAGASACLPKASGRVTIHSVGAVEIMHVAVTGLPPKTDFDFFVIQVPKAPFGMSWYQGDIETDHHGNGHATFIGRFSIETFMVAPGSAPAPVVFNGPFPDASLNPPTNPIQMYHLGLWFDSPADAQKAGCAGTVTPFNGQHDAGIQALNTSNFPDAAGPLRNIQ